MRLSGLEKRCISAASCVRDKRPWYGEKLNLSSAKKDCKNQGLYKLVPWMQLMLASAVFHVGGSFPSPELDKFQGTIQLDFVS